jgi:hypothetical protein
VVGLPAAVQAHDLATALTARRRAIAHGRDEACRSIVSAYHGELGFGLTSEWLDAPREALRRDVLDAVLMLVEQVREEDPQQALDLLETARDIDAHNEQTYRDIMRLQHQLGRAPAIEHTLALLTACLAELDAAPERETVALAERLRH